MRRDLLAGLSLALTLTAGAAGATTYTTRAAFNAAFPGALIEDFNGFAEGPYSNFMGIPPLAKVSSSSGAATGYIRDYDGPYSGNTFHKVLQSANAGGGPDAHYAVQFEFTQDVFGFAFDDLDLVGPVQEYVNVEINFANGFTDSFQFVDKDYNFATSAFFGFASPVAIRSFSVASYDPSDDSPMANGIDNVAISLVAPSGVVGGGKENDGPPAAVPEPASWALTILGFGGAGVALRRRSRAFA